ncbi:MULTISPECIES: hypothetical protein [Streptomycetaceae]|uniref:hypothetical protein n=1 Tax=Streptomycetaceae TaxID=2062 RepID=UPI0013011616|nr:hypothetical protein [Streptomyces sp. CB02056]
MTEMRRFVCKIVFSLAVVAAVVGAGSLAIGADSQDGTAGRAAVAIADDISWQ